MQKDKQNSIMKHIREVLVTLSLVSCFFLLLLFLLGMFFPSGMRVNQLIYQASGGGGGPLNSNRLISFGGKEGSLEGSEWGTAILASKQNIIKSKRANSVAWVKASKGMKLYNRDAIQTSSNSSASIMFDEGNLVQIGENSLLIIRHFEEDIFISQRRSQILMINGEINGRVSGSENKSVLMEVSLPNGVASIRSHGASGDQAEFKITVNPDKSSTISLYSGSAEITSRGKTVKVEENQSTKINLMGFPSPPVFLPEVPRLVLPEMKKTYYFRELPPQIRFMWTVLDNVSNFHFVLAQDPAFEKTLVNEKFSRSYFDHGNLKIGHYFWRVSSVGEVGESAFSQTGQFQVLQDLEPPSLRVEFPPEFIDHGEFVLAGFADQDSKVFVDMEPVSITPKGEFFHKLQLQTGPNIIVVEAWDQAGNVKYRSKMVHAKIQ